MRRWRVPGEGGELHRQTYQANRHYPMAVRFTALTFFNLGMLVASTCWIMREYFK